MSRQKRKDTSSEPEEIETVVPARYNLPARPHDAGIDRILTAVLQAGEAAVAPLLEGLPHPCVTHAKPEKGGDTSLPEDYGGLLSVLAQIRALLGEDANLAALVAQLPAAFGDGNLLRALFHNLFPSPRSPKVLDKNGKPILTPREVKVLGKLNDDYSAKWIAAELGISVPTVKKHISHIPG